MSWASPEWGSGAWGDVREPLMAQYIRALPAPVLVQVGANHMAGLSQLLGASQVAVHNGYGGFQKDTRAEQVLEKFGLVDMLLEQLTLPDVDYGFPPFQQLEIQNPVQRPVERLPFGVPVKRPEVESRREPRREPKRESKQERKEEPRPIRLNQLVLPGRNKETS